MQSRWCRAWSRPNLTDFVHIFSKRGYLQCVFVHWRDLETKSKSTAYLLENWNSSTTAPDALFSPWWASTASSDRLCCSSWSCFRCATALSACTLPAYPRLENHPFRRTRASDVGAALPCLRPGFPILASHCKTGAIPRPGHARVWPGVCGVGLVVWPYQGTPRTLTRARQGIKRGLAIIPWSGYQRYPGQATPRYDQEHVA